MIFGASLRKSFSYGMFVSKRFKIVLFWFGAEIRFWGNNNFCCPSVACTSTAFCSSVSAARGGVAASRFLDAAVRIEVFPEGFSTSTGLAFPPASGQTHARPTSGEHPRYRRYSQNLPKQAWSVNSEVPAPDHSRRTQELQ